MKVAVVVPNRNCEVSIALALNQRVRPEIIVLDDTQLKWDEEYIFAFLDGNAHYTSKNALSRLMEPFESPKVGLSYCDYEVVGMRIYREPFVAERLLASDIVGRNYLVSGAALSRAGGFGPDKYELAKRISRDFMLIHTPDCLIWEGGH